MVTDIYKQYFKADAEFSGVRRNGAIVVWDEPLREEMRA